MASMQFDLESWRQFHDSFDSQSLKIQFRIGAEFRPILDENKISLVFKCQSSKSKCQTSLKVYQEFNHCSMFYNLFTVPFEFLNISFKE